MIPYVHSIKSVELQYSTGERPILVLCSDRNEYVCKYVRGGNSAYKLVAEVVGSILAKAWRIPTPDTAFVELSPAHWYRREGERILAYGSRRMDGVVDITLSTVGSVFLSAETIVGLQRIALFDFWTANEDRNANNANLMYDMVHDRMVSIDYGCILNTATFDAPISQLTFTDSILHSYLYRQQTGVRKEVVVGLKEYFDDCIERCRRIAPKLVDTIPEIWGIPRDAVTSKLEELLSPTWVDAVWENFADCLSDNFSV